MRRNWRMIAVVLGVLGLASVLLPTGAGAQKVLNPGSFSLSASGGQIIVGTGLNIRLTPNPLPECSDGIDNDRDGLIDAADWKCAAGPAGQPKSDDNSEVAPGFQPKVDVSIVGNIDAAGNMTIPASGVVFPPSYVKLPHPVDGSLAVATANILPTTAATGSLNPITGEMTMTVKLRVKISGDLWGNWMSDSCSVGTVANPITVRFTTGTLPPVGGAPAVSGSAYNATTGRALMVSNDFFVPGAGGCTAGWFDLNDTINGQVGLPSPVGKNLASLSGSINPIIGAGIKAKISSTPLVLSGEAPFSVDFSSAGSSAVKGPATYRWEFGDGSTSTDPNPTHVFNTSGVNVTKLTVTDTDGDSASTTVNVTVTGGVPGDLQPVARIKTNPSPATGNAPLTVAFDGSTSTPGDNPATYEWTFGDGGTATGVNASHTYTAAGDYTAKLKVTDSDGDVSEATVAVKANVATSPVPVARITTTPTPASGTAPLTVAFDGSTSTVQDAPGTFEWTFGDGVTATGVNASHTYTAAGNYTAKLKVTDSDGDTSTATVAVNVADTPVPVARIKTTPTPATGNAPLTVAFDGSTSSVANGPGSYVWTFGDGASSSGVNVSHTYTAPGDYTATLKITDKADRVSTATVPVKVNAAPQPPATSDTVSVKFAGSFNYLNSGSGTGNISVARDAFGLAAVGGYLDIPSKVSGTARVMVDVNRVWILPLWAGNVTVIDQAAGVNQSTPLLGGVNTTTSPSTAGSTTNWFKLGSFPDLIQPYTLIWSVTDAN